MLGRTGFRRVAVAAAVVIGLVATATPSTAAVPEVQLTVAPTVVEPGATVHIDVTLNNVNGFTILGPAALVLSGPAPIMSFTTLAGCDAAGGCTTGSFGSGPLGYKGVLPEAISGGDSATVGFDLKLAADAPAGTYALQGQLVGSNYASEVVTGPDLVVEPPADTAVTVTAVPDIGLLESRLTVTVAVRNAGPGILRTATVTSPLPRGATATSTGCSVASGSVSCTVTGVPVGVTRTATFVVPVRLLALGQQTFTVTRVSSAPRDPNPANDSASVRCNVLTRLLITCGGK